MKWLFSIIFLFTVNKSYTQSRNFNSIDWEVQFIDAPTPDSLAIKLTLPYKTELEKVRSIFSWITQNIAYNTSIYSKRNFPSKFASAPLDTITEWKSANEMTALRVLQRRIAVCDGYARLFKTLCDYSGIRSEVILGYGKCNRDRSLRFRSNHTWNSVMIDSNWHLLDVTWGSGYLNFGDEFIQRTDESYFLTAPERFILDHYPEDIRWTLLDEHPVVREFKHSPFRYKSFVKYSIQSYFPGNGLIEAAIGDTIKIDLQVKYPERDKQISCDPFFDSTIFTHSPSWVFLEPFQTNNKYKLTYSYVVNSKDAEWIHILYNNDLVLRYRLRIREDKLARK